MRSGSPGRGYTRGTAPDASIGPGTGYRSPPLSITTPMGAVEADAL
jgi:hypothetical protein